MESNLCDGNHSDSNVLLPPRKRLLAGFKKRNSNCSHESPSTCNGKGAFDTRIDTLLKYHLKNPNLSLKEIVEESSRAAEEAVKVAVAARAVAKDKEVVAAKAMARAKSVLELVEDISDEVCSHDRHLKKNKMKKHLPVKMLYNKHGNAGNCKTDEELALRLHHAMNSSPRITKSSVSSNLKSKKHKRVKSLSIGEGSKVTINGHGESETEETDSEDLMGEGRICVSENTSNWNKDESLKIVNGEAESSQRSLESSDDLSSFGRKRGRMKQKKLPLSICSFRDLANASEEMKSKGALLSEENIGKNNAAPSFVGARPDSMMAAKPASMWKCKASRHPIV